MSKKIDDMEGLPTNEIKEVEGEFTRSFRERLEEFGERINYEAGIPKMYVYKYDPTGKVRSLSNRFDISSISSIPDEHDLGLMFGGGKYLISISYFDLEGTRKQKSYDIRISNVYDDLRRNALLDGSANALFTQYAGIPLKTSSTYHKPEDSINSITIAQPTVNVRETMQESFNQLKEMISLITPLIQVKQPVNDLGSMQVMYKMMQEMMRQQLKDSSDLMSDFQRQLYNSKMGIPENEVPQVTEPKNNIESLLEMAKPFLPLIKQFLPQLFGANVNTTETIANLAQSVGSVLQGSGQTINTVINAGGQNE